MFDILIPDVIRMRNIFSVAWILTLDCGKFEITNSENRICLRKSGPILIITAIYISGHIYKTIKGR